MVDYADLRPDADVRKGLAVRSEQVEESADAVQAWLRGDGQV